MYLKKMITKNPQSDGLILSWGDVTVSYLSWLLFFLLKMSVRTRCVLFLDYLAEEL